MRTLLLLLISLLLCDGAAAQKLLQLEKINSARTRKYFPGQELHFQVHGGQWYTRVMEDISYEQGLLFFPKDHIHLDSISALRFFDRQRWSRPLSNQFFNFAAVWSVYSLVDEAFRDDAFEQVPQSTYLVPATSVATGLLIRHLFKKRTYRFEKNKKGEAKRWRLRLLDLDVKPLIQKP